MYRIWFMQIHTETVLHLPVGGEPRKVYVLYVDYGNCELVAESDVQALPEAFCQIPAYAIPCALSQVSSDLCTEIKTFIGICKFARI